MSKDAVQVAPHVYRVLFENERVRVLRATLKPGAKSEMHAHPPNVVYALSSGRAKFTSADGKSQEVDMKSGETYWFDAVVHSSENTGNVETQALIVELKK